MLLQENSNYCAEIPEQPPVVDDGSPEEQGAEVESSHPYQFPLPEVALQPQVVHSARNRVDLASTSRAAALCGNRRRNGAPSHYAVIVSKMTPP